MNATQVAAQAWALDHQLTVLAQIESRPAPPDGKGDRWMERRTTGKVIAACSCGYNTGLIDRGQLSTFEELAAEHPRSM